MKNNSYESPAMEILALDVEQGFADSIQQYPSDWEDM